MTLIMSSCCSPHRYLHGVCGYEELDGMKYDVG